MGSTNDQAAQTVIRTPAKLNLTLRILGRRDDGYHDLNSVFVAVDLYDTITIDRRNDERFTLRIVGGSADISPTDNLILKAASAFQSAALETEIDERKIGANFVLTKRIPSQAGLGGGSSDAAATLIGLNQLCRRPLREDYLHAIAATLGSDLNFFMGRTAIAVGSGRGERISPITQRCHFHGVIAKPPFGAATGKIFKALDLAKLDSQASMPTPDMIAELLAGRMLGQNDLMEPLQAVCPEFSCWFEKLNAIETGWSLTGSGTSVFRIMPNRLAASRLAARIRLACGGTFACVAGPGRMAVGTSPS